MSSEKWTAGYRRFRTIQKYKNLEPPKIFLCNWYIKLVKPGKELPLNQVQCQVPMKMTKCDIRNYFKKIYGVEVAKVHTRIQEGKRKRLPNNTYEKKADFKVAYLHLANQTFRFPDLFSKYQHLRPNYQPAESDDQPVESDDD